MQLNLDDFVVTPRKDWSEQMKAHRALPLLVLFLQALALAQDNPLTPLRQDPKVEKIGLGNVVFKQTRESVWTAVTEAMTSYNWRPQTMDSAAGVVFPSKSLPRRCLSDEGLQWMASSVQ